MATEKKQIGELLQDTQNPNIDKAFIQVKTNANGFLGTYKGYYTYYVSQENGEYFVYPIEGVKENELLVYKNSTIIYTDSDNIHFVVKTLKDPFDHPAVESHELNGRSKEKAVLDAFLAFAENRFEFGDWHTEISHQPQDVFNLVSGETIKLVDELGKSIQELDNPYIREKLELEKLEFAKQDITLNLGDRTVLEPVFTPHNTTDKRLVFKVNNRNVEVSPDGVVLGVQEGKSVITAKAVNGGKESEITVTVNPSAKAQVEDSAVDSGSETNSGDTETTGSTENSETASE